MNPTASMYQMYKELEKRNRLIGCNNESNIMVYFRRVGPGFCKC